LKPCNQEDTSSLTDLVQSWPEITRLARSAAALADPASCEEAPMPEPLFTDREGLSAVCRRHHIRLLSLFGSVLKGTNRAESDVDLLVEFERGKEPGLIGLARIEAELSALLNGRPVDLRTPGDLSRYFRDEVIRTAEAQYAA
jgi:predicted nucleotidyltransferase